MTLKQLTIVAFCYLLISFMLDHCLHAVIHYCHEIVYFDAVLLCSQSKRLEITCPQQVRMGRKEDGGWDVCVAGPYNIVKPCLVYSFG